MATITASATGGNWNATAAWVGGVVPLASDDVVLDATSGQITVNVSTAVCRSLDCTGYTNTLTINASSTLTIGDATAGAGNKALTFSTGMTFTPANVSTSKIVFASTSGTSQAITFSTKTFPSMDFNSGTYALSAAMTTAGTAGKRFECWERRSLRPTSTSRPLGTPFK